MAGIAARGLNKDVLRRSEVVVLARREGAGELLARPETPYEVRARGPAQEHRRDVAALCAATEAARINRGVAIYNDADGTGLKEAESS